MAQPPVLRVSGIGRTFGATRALRDVGLEFARGTVTGLLGENGSGKSTLVKILAGLVEPDQSGGTIEVAGSRIGPPITPAIARQAGFRFMHQDLALVHELTVADNVALSDGFLSRLASPVRTRSERARTTRLLSRFGVGVSPGRLIADLSPSERTMVAVARAFGPEDESPRLVVLDEPTAALPAGDVSRVLEAIREATRNGTAVILVTHRLEEVLQVTDSVAVLRDGRVVAGRRTAGLMETDLVRLMLGQQMAGELNTAALAPQPSGGAVLSLRGVSGHRLAEVDLDLHPGEVLGIGGLQGCGRSELTRIISGAQRPQAGEILLDGTARPGFSGPHEALALGIGSVPQDRRQAGIILDLSLRENLTLGDLSTVQRGFTLRRSAERREARSLVQQFDIRPPNTELPLRSFSGGNQQKAALARILRLKPRIVVLDEPTQGIDVGARHQIGQIIRRLCGEGVAVLLASSDGDELIELADRVVILDRGRVDVTLRRAGLSRERLALAVGGGKVAV